MHLMGLRHESVECFRDREECRSCSVFFKNRHSIFILVEKPVVKSDGKQFLLALLQSGIDELGDSHDTPMLSHEFYLPLEFGDWARVSAFEIVSRVLHIVVVDEVVVVV